MTRLGWPGRASLRWPYPQSTPNLACPKPMGGLPLTSGPLPSQPSAKCTLGSVASTSLTYSLPLCHVPATAGHFYPSPL